MNMPIFVFLQALIAILNQTFISISIIEFRMINFSNQVRQGAGATQLPNLSKVVFAVRDPLHVKTEDVNVTSCDITDTQPL